jgi:acyl dehydratase
MSEDFYVSVGQSVTFAKTVSETDVYMFAGITGDFAPVHVNDEMMKQTAFGRRIAHGALLVGFMSTLSTMLVAQSRDSQAAGETPVALGYDRIRFTAPVFMGDTVTLTYTIAEVDLQRRRTSANIEARNQRGETVAAAIGLLKWVKNK